jgi:hypothetical protein
MTPSGRFFLSLFADIFVIGRLEECEEVFSFTNVHTALFTRSQRRKRNRKVDNKITLLENNLFAKIQLC